MTQSLKQIIKFHLKLNPLIWFNDQMRLPVRIRLLRTALAFYRFLEIPGLVVHDIVLTGSNAGFNYTTQSDLDVHLVVNLATTPCPDLTETLFLTKKALWADQYTVTIHGHVVELYVEDAASPAKSNGVYSILRGHWLKRPVSIAPAVDDHAVSSKAKMFKNEINDLLAGHPTEQQIDHLFARIRLLRQNGLLKGGEFSTENLAYKVLRSTGYLDRLFDARKKSVEHDLSLTETMRGLIDLVNQFGPKP